MSTVQESVILNTSSKKTLCVKNFESMTLEEQNEFIEITFNKLKTGLKNLFILNT